MDKDAVPQNGQQYNDLEKQLETVRQEAAENHDKYLRALAASQNMRKRLERLCEERMWQEKKRLLTHLLELSDQLEEALKYVVAGDPVGAGVRITHQQLHNILAQEGVRALQSVGETFDPNIHEAVEFTDNPGEQNKVTHEYRKGYMAAGRLLRPARVQVTRTD